ncbi:hypothetical protein GAO09_19510 [Rhizobiales bacterium RZME27]|uniref:Uncharacterized protein n=1 Tax=Endobacterium cereale TaxID=2663029 RepID=A0A6A8AAD9_9HYPH|nr:hypothetical protein [Endobacterium cereale]MQY48225.1 hypothetical protein [Endobacterium cereale]
MAKIEVRHLDLEKAACRKAIQLLDAKKIDTAWGANGLVGETAIQLLKTEEFLIPRDIMGLQKTPATREEADLTARLIMAGMCGDWPEKYGYYPDDPRAKAILRAA